MLMDFAVFDSYESFVQMLLKRDGYFTKEKTEAEQARLAQLKKLRDSGRPGHDRQINDIETRLRIRGYKESN